MRIKKIEGYDNYYITDSGKVMSIIGDVKWLKQDTNNKGYKIVGLYKDEKRSKKSVHRLVSEAFIPNPDKLPEVDHIDGNPQNNRVENLRWCTHKENCSFPLVRKRRSEVMKGKLAGEKNPMHGKHHTEETRKKISEAKKGLLAGEKNPMYGKPRPEGAGRTPKSVEQWSKDGIVLIARYESASEAERQTGCHQGSISKCCLGKCKSAGGYRWQYQ